MILPENVNREQLLSELENALGMTLKISMGDHLSIRDKLSDDQWVTITNVVKTHKPANEIPLAISVNSGKLAKELNDAGVLASVIRRSQNNVVVRFDNIPDVVAINKVTSILSTHDATPDPVIEPLDQTVFFRALAKKAQGKLLTTDEQAELIKAENS